LQVFNFLKFKKKPNLDLIEKNNFHLAIFGIIALLFGFYNFNIYGFSFYIGFILLTPLFLKHLREILNKIKSIKNFFFITLFFFITHSLLSFFLFNISIFDMYDSDKTYLLKMLLSVPIYIGCILTGYSISRSNLFDELAWRNLSRLIFIFAIFITCINIFQFFLVHIFELKSHYFEKNLYYGFFGEPSFFAKAMILIITTLFFLGYENKKMIAMIWFISWITSMSLTYTFLSILLATLIVMKVSFRYKYLIIAILLMIFFLLIFAYPSFFNYFYIRLSSLKSGIQYAYYQVDLNSIPNTFAYYYITAILDVINSLKLTLGFGTGFNTMGILPRDPHMPKLFSKLWHNKFDGSFLLAKMIYEFGIFAISIYIYLIYKSFLTFIKSHNVIQITCASIVIMTMAIFTVRSCVYFLELYFILALPYLFIKTKSKNFTKNYQ